MGLERGTVELEPHTPEWARRYEEEVGRLKSIVGERIVEYEHVGSTAIEAVPAKPIVDVIGVVENDAVARELIPILADHGYEYRPNDPVEDRVFLAKGPRSDRTYYLSLTERGSESYREQIAFRDYLRTNPDVADEYAQLKRDLASEYADDRASYTEAKSEFVADVLVRALDDV